MIGTAYIHTVIDDHSRVAYAEICCDEKARTATAVLRRAVAWFSDHGGDVERVLSDNGSCYRSFAWRDVCAELGIKHKRTRPYRPQTNGKIERFHRTLADGWAYAQFTNQPHTATPPFRDGCTSTITTASTPSSAAHPTADSTTCLDITAATPARLRRVGRARLAAWLRTLPRRIVARFGR